MLTVTSLNAAIPSPPRPPNSNAAHRKPVKARAVCCLRSNRDVNSLYNKASPNAGSKGHDNVEMTQVGSACSKKNSSVVKWGNGSETG